LEAAVKEAGTVEVLGVWDREHLDRAIGYIKDALNLAGDMEEKEGV
jgi:hypothetical protein